MKTLLAALDFSSNTEPVLGQAARLAKDLKAKLWLLHVTSSEFQSLIRETTPFNDFAPEFSAVPGDVQLARDISAEEIRHEHSRLQQLSAGLRGKGVDATAMIVKGEPAQMIAAKAEDLDADIIILGSHGHRLIHKAFLGSTSETLMQHTTRNVMIVPMVEE